MKLKNGDIQGAVIPLQALIRHELDFDESFEIVKLVNKLNVPLKDISDMRQKLIEQHNTADPGQRAEVKQGTPEFESFQEDWDKLMDKEVELEYEKVKVTISSSNGQFKIAPAALMALDKFVIFERTADKPPDNRAQRRRQARSKAK